MKYNTGDTKLYIFYTIIIFGIISFLFIFIYLEKHKDFMYLNYGSNSNFRYDYSFFIKSGNIYYYVIGNLEIINDKIKIGDVKTTSLFCGNRLIVKEDSIISGILSEKFGYNEYFQEDFIENLDKVYLEITYLYNNELQVDKINILFLSTQL